MIHAAIFHMLVTASFTTWQMLGISQLYPRNPLLDQQENILSSFKHLQDLWCAMGNLPKYNCLTEPLCSLLDSEVSHFPIASTFSPIQHWESGERNSKPASKPRKFPSQVGTCCSPLQIIWSCAEAAAWQGQGWVSRCYSKAACARSARAGGVHVCLSCVCVPGVPQPRVLFPYVCPWCLTSQSSPGPALRANADGSAGRQPAHIHHHPGTACPALCFGNFTPQSFWNWGFYSTYSSFHTFSHSNHPHNNFPLCAYHIQD